MLLKKESILKLTMLMIFLRSPMFIFFLGTYLISNKNILIKFLLNVLPFLLLLSICVIYSIHMDNNVYFIVGQSRDILLCMIVFLAFSIISYHKNNLNNIYYLIKILLIYLGLIKIFLILGSILFGLSVSDVINFISDNTSLQLMTMGVEGGLSRLQLPIDSVLPFCIFFLLFEIFDKKTIHKKNLIFQLIILICSLILTFSRAFWLVTAIFIIIYFIFNHNFVQKIKYLFVSMFLIFILLLIPPVRELIFIAIGARFGKDAKDLNYYSDLERHIQNNNLLEAFYNAPLLGNGIGYYIPNLIRSDETKYLYESQFLSMFMSLGIFFGGVFFLMIYFYIINFNSKFKNDINFVHLYLIPTLMFVLWILLGSTNPLLFGASGGIILFFCSSYSSIFLNSKSLNDV